MPGEGRVKSKSGRILVSTRSATFAGLPAWMSLSCLMMAITSKVSTFTSTSGATLRPSYRSTSFSCVPVCLSFLPSGSFR